MRRFMTTDNLNHFPFVVDLLADQTKMFTAPTPPRKFIHLHVAHIVERFIMADTAPAFYWLIAI